MKKKESRRRFLKNVAGISAVALTTPLAVAPAHAPQQPAPQQPSPTTPTQAQLLGEIVRQRYGQFLTPDQLSDVMRSLDGALQRAKRLREFKLKNSDEPDFVFRVLE
jgi:Spy/CpxP family protein refolding chaperone